MQENLSEETKKVEGPDSNTVFATFRDPYVAASDVKGRRVESAVI